MRQDCRFISVHTENRNLLICPRSLVTVHLRTHGEQSLISSGVNNHVGSSPYTRRTGFNRLGLRVAPRFISVHTENRSHKLVPEFCRAVHLRTHGEQIKKRTLRGAIAGSSPYTRRTGHLVFQERKWPRFISVHTENRAYRTGVIKMKPVHLRTHGEQSLSSRSFKIFNGSSPYTRRTEGQFGARSARSRFISVHTENSNGRD